MDNREADSLQYPEDTGNEGVNQKMIPNAHLVLTVMLGKENVDWFYYTTCPIHWEIWVKGRVN